ncbi:hypothetical protein [Sodalis sp. RH22]|uniref:hypothetical protein n=1 Tax=unclassified Sodalis (in: enterobacteria) TaxID=2636512 RepID=UPI0039B58426
MKELIPVLTAFLGALFTFMITYFSNKWSDKRFDKQLSYEKDKENKKLLLEKGEQLDVLISIWSKSIFSYQMCQMKVMRGNLTSEGMMESLKLQNPKNDHDRMESLLHIYFPELLSHLDKAKAELALGNAAFDSFEKSKGEKEVLFNKLYNSNIAIEKHLQNLNSDIRKKLYSHLH